MVALSVLVRLMLLGVFVTSAIAKAADGAGSASSVRAFGVPQRFVQPITWSLPLLEAAGAVLLLGSWLPLKLGAALLLGLLLAFTTGVVYNLVGRNTPDCHCFGKLSREPISWRIVGRNAALAAAAIELLAAPRPDLGPSVTAAISAATSFQLVVGVLVVALGVAVVFLVVTVADLREQVRRAALLRAGADGGWALPNLDQGVTTLGSLLQPNRKLVLLFVSPGCGPCRRMTPEIPHWQQALARTADIVALSTGTSVEVAEKFAGYGVTVLLDKDDAVAKLYGVDATPCAVILDADGTQIGSPVCAVDEIQLALLPLAEPLPLDADARPTPPPARRPPRDIAIIPSPVREVPDAMLVTPTGKLARLRDALESPGGTLIALWDSNCGFCRRLHDNLEDWARARDPAVGFVVVTSDQPGTLIGEFTGTVLHDPGFTVGNQLGLDGTPTAVWLRAGETYVTNVAEGGEAVLQLARVSEMSLDKT